MAGFIIPIATAVIPAVAPFVAKLLDKIFPPKTGSNKLDAGTEILAAIQAGLQNAKVMTGTPLDGTQIRTALQSVVDSLNSQGELKGVATTIEASSAAVSGLADLLIHIANVMKGVH